MNVVADTNVLAYYLLGTPAFYAEAKLIWDNLGSILAPAHWQAEWANVVWLTTRAGHMDWDEVPEKLAMAEDLDLITWALAPLWRGALEYSRRTGVAVYDTLFVELAAQQGCRLATFDQQVLRAFPEIACRPRDLPSA